MSEMTTAEMQQVQGGREASAPNISEIVVTKLMDSTSPLAGSGGNYLTGTLTLQDSTVSGN